LHCFKLQVASLPEINRISKNKGDRQAHLLLSRIIDLERQTTPDGEVDLDSNRSYRILVQMNFSSYSLNNLGI
jgi:hypothetical protein